MIVSVILPKSKQKHNSFLVKKKHNSFIGSPSSQNPRLAQRESLYKNYLKDVYEKINFKSFIELKVLASIQSYIFGNYIIFYLQADPIF